MRTTTSELTFSLPVDSYLKDSREFPIADKNKCIDKLWSIGQDHDWYYGQWLWNLRGRIDKFLGGRGMGSKRTSEEKLLPGDNVDFWKVIESDREGGRLLLQATMKMPGKAWLEFKVNDLKITQTVFFQPSGLWGRLYWYSLQPLHNLMFQGLIEKHAFNCSMTK